MTKPWGLYVLPMEGQPEFEEVPYDACNMNYLKRKVAELQNMPKEE